MQMRVPSKEKILLKPHHRLKGNLLKLQAKGHPHPKQEQAGVLPIGCAPPGPPCILLEPRMPTQKRDKCPGHIWLRHPHKEPHRG